VELEGEVLMGWARSSARALRIRVCCPVSGTRSSEYCKSEPKRQVFGHELTRSLISTEKGVMQMAERLGLGASDWLLRWTRLMAETQKAAAALQPYGAQEGPDLHDILNQSSTLLNQLGTALAVFVDHSANLRTCYKRIREREEALDDLRRRRRATGAKAETAEKKLAKMGPENKQLPSQTELLESLRGQMRQVSPFVPRSECA